MSKSSRPDRLSLRGIFSVDINCDLEDWQPDDRRRVRIEILLSLGWDDDPWADDFYVSCVTNDLRRQSHTKTRGAIFIDSFDWSNVRESIVHIIAKCERVSWDESLVELRKCFRWEYEGMAGT